MALRLSGVVSPERQAAVDVYNRGSSGCKSPLLTQSHSINCFRAKLQVSLWNLKKFKRQAGGQAADPTRGEKAADHRRGQHQAKPSTFRGEKRGKRGGEAGCDCNGGWAFEVQPRIRSFETSTCKFHAERRAHK